MELDLSRLSLAIRIQPSFEPEESYLLSYSADKDTGKISGYLVQGPDAANQVGVHQKVAL